MHLCADTLTESPMLFLNVLFGLSECDFLHVELREKKKIEGEKAKQSFATNVLDPLLYGV